MTLKFIVIRVRKLSESRSNIYGHYTGQNHLKRDALSFLRLITKLQSHLALILVFCEITLLFFIQAACFDTCHPCAI